MSCILYYSNFCEQSKKMLQVLSKTQNTNLHFICIDSRIKENGKTYIILKNQEKIILPQNVTHVPALLLLNQNYAVIFGDKIYDHLRPQHVQQTKVATKNHMEPVSQQDGFSTFGGFSSGIVSDSYSFLDQSESDLTTLGNGGLKQTHSYVTLAESMNLNIHLPQDNNSHKSNKMKAGDINMEDLQRRREEELNGIHQQQFRKY
jgi:hypothetical protein